MTIETIKLDTNRWPERYFEHRFYNEHLGIIAVFPSDELYALFKEQTAGITKKVPVTDQFPSIFDIIYLDLEKGGEKLEGNPKTGEQLLYEEHWVGLVRGASFDRISPKVTFSGNDGKAQEKGKISPNQIHSIILTEDQMTYRQQLRLLFDEKGAIVTRDDYLERWEKALSGVQKYKTAKKMMGANIRLTGLNPDKPKNPEL